MRSLHEVYTINIEHFISDKGRQIDTICNVSVGYINGPIYFHMKLRQEQKEHRNHNEIWNVFNFC